MVRSFVHVSEIEKRLTHNMKKAGLTWSKIQEITERSSDTIQKVLAAKCPPLPMKTATLKGVKKDREHLNFKKADVCVKAKGIIAKDDFLALVSAAKALHKEVKGEKDVSIAMIKERAGVSACDRTCLESFHANGIWYRKLKERPILTDADVKERYQWGLEKERRSGERWVTKPHCIIDNKHFQFYTNKNGRQHAARRGVQGAYSKEGTRPENFLVKPKKAQKFPAPGITVTAAVIKGRIRMWDYVDGRGSAGNAAAMYEGPLCKAMSKAYPEIAAKPYAKWVVLEDNDPAGYKARKAMQAKERAGIVTEDLPKRSPDLNVLDYCLWHEINVRMRIQEQSFSEDYKESIKDYKARLRRTALGLPTALVSRAVADMKRRTKELVAGKGRLFVESK
jgi:hypothetical protein